MMQITSGKINSALRCCLYGVEGIGKTTFASRFPNPVFIDTEGSTKHFDIRRTPAPQSWTQLLEQVKYFIAHPGELGTLVVDTADWAERLCIEQICASRQLKSLEDAGYGRGYVFLAEEFGRLLNLLSSLVDCGVHVVLVAHAALRKFEQPDEMGAYDRWELKLSKKVSPMVKEWSDLLLFANYRTIVVNVDGQGAAKGKNKAQGGKRVMYTAHGSCWDAKNRFGLPDELPFEFDRIVHLFNAPLASSPTTKETSEPSKDAAVPPPAAEPAEEIPAEPTVEVPEEPVRSDVDDEIPPELLALMAENKVTAQELRLVVTQRGYYPEGTLIRNYAPDFVKGCLIAAWTQVFALIEKNRGNTPF